MGALALPNGLFKGPMLDVAFQNQIPCSDPQVAAPMEPALQG